MKRTALDAFGAVLMEQVRDRSIREWDMVVDGRAQAPYYQTLHQRLALMSDEDRAILSHIISQVVDSTLHNLLWAVDQEWFDISAQTEEGAMPSLRDASLDEVSGVMFEWIELYSTQRYVPDFL